MPPLRSLDLFTGCGGLTHGLRAGLARPVMYCERDPEAVATLTALMAANALPRAPIHPDVVTLKGAALRGTVDLLCAGFPCVGFSTAGARDGFANDAGSGLYKHVVRLVDEVRPPVVFLENVAAICTGSGLDGVLGTLGARGYHVWWLVLPAAGVGAPHLRKRWWCLAVHKAAAANKKRWALSTPAPPPRFAWRGAGASEPARMLLAPAVDARQKARLAMLGNSVVPDAVRAAFLMLWTGVHSLDVLTRTTHVLAVPAAGAAPPLRAGACREAGVLLAGAPAIAALAPPLALPRARDLGLVLDPAAVPRPVPMNPAVRTELLTAPLAIKAWGTPRYGNTNACSVLTRRSKNDLATQVRFERRTPARLRPGVLNPAWVEWLMGYPPGWTAAGETGAVSTVRQWRRLPRQ